MYSYKNTPEMIEVKPVKSMPLVKDNKYAKHMALVEKKRKVGLNHFQFESESGQIYGALLDRKIAREKRDSERKIQRRMQERLAASAREQSNDDQDGARCIDPANNVVVHDELDDYMPRFGQTETFTGINWDLYPPGHHAALENMSFDNDKFLRRMRLLTEYTEDLQYECGDECCLLHSEASI